MHMFISRKHRDGAGEELQLGKSLTPQPMSSTSCKVSGRWIASIPHLRLAYNERRTFVCYWEFFKDGIKVSLIHIYGPQTGSLLNYSIQTAKKQVFCKVNGSKLPSQDLTALNLFALQGFLFALHGYLATLWSSRENGFLFQLNRVEHRRQMLMITFFLQIHWLIVTPTFLDQVAIGGKRHYM